MYTLNFNLVTWNVIKIKINFHRSAPQFHLHYLNLHKMRLWLELENFSGELLLLDISNHNTLIWAKIV